MKLDCTEIKKLKIPKPVKLRKDFLLNYLHKAPSALALVRSLECDILSRQDIIPPVMDYGCGDGLFASILFDERVDCGVDISRKKLKIAEQIGIYERVFDNAQADVPIKPGRFNTVLANSVLEHAEDLDGSLNQIYNLMSEEGKLYVTVPSDQHDKHTVIFEMLTWLEWHNWARKSRKGFNNFWRHNQCYSEKCWAKKFSDTGFKIISIERYAPKAFCLLRDLCVPLALPSLITMRLFGRWILFEPLRRVYIKSVYKALLKKTARTNNEGALLFFALQKNDA